ncbi:MAG TPA: hypothetical protein VFT12_00110, partial [Thermoanaerobaculia bacterium]|nr:hypothetical protein [Thermoanaerobaculia bacterium]
IISMTPLTALWLPILLSAVFVFIASSIIHMAPLWHRSDYPPLPDQERFRNAVAPMAIPPGDYMVPRAPGMAEMKTPEFQEKTKVGPNMILTVMPNLPWTMGKTLFQWFLFSVVVSIFAAYIAGRALGPGAYYLDVFRFAGATSFIAYTVAAWPQSIWYARGWNLTLKQTLDGLIYSLLTAGTFGWLWPR